MLLMPKFGGVSNIHVFNIEQVQSLVMLGLQWNWLMLQGCVVHEAGLRGHQMHCNGEGGCVGGSRIRIRGLHGSRGVKR